MKLRKGQFGTYSITRLGGWKVRAMVLTVHRDGTITIEARHALDEKGKIQGGYLGYRYRMKAENFTLEAA